MGHFGVSVLEVLVFFEQWAGHRLLSENVAGPHVRANRPISISSVPVSERFEIRHGCQFAGGFVRALTRLRVEWVGSCRVVLVPTCFGYGIWGGINVLMVLLRGRQGLVTTSASRLYVGVLGFLKGQQRSFLVVL